MRSMKKFRNPGQRRKSSKKCILPWYFLVTQVKIGHFQPKRAFFIKSGKAASGH